jgi:hypothetical protein
MRQPPGSASGIYGNLRPALDEQLLSHPSFRMRFGDLARAVATHLRSPRERHLPDLMAFRADQQPRMKGMNASH